MRSHLTSIARVFLCATALLGAAGCEDDLPKASKIDKLRTLAIRATPPQINPGEASTFTSLTIDPTGQPITYHWYACVIPENSTSIFKGDNTANSGSNAGLNSGYTCRDAVADGLDLAVDLGSDHNASLTVPADFLTSTDAINIYYGLPDGVDLPPPFDQWFIEVAGVNITITLVASTPDGVEVVTAKRLNISAPPTLPNDNANTNPVDIAFMLALSDDLPLNPQVTPPPDGRCFVGEPKPSLIPDTTYYMRPLNIPSPQQAYLVLLTSIGGADIPFEIREVTEESYFSYYSTKGDFSVAKTKLGAGTGSGKWRLEKEALDAADIWIVVRNGRGGTSWCHDTLTVTESL